MKTVVKTALVALAAISAAATIADAAPRKRQAYGSDVIVVRPRAFTDSGTVVPVGTS